MALKTITENEHVTELLRDIRTEAMTSMRNLEPDDPLKESIEYISDVATKAINYINT